MRIGLTYDLRSVYLAEGYSDEATAEFDREDTIVALETALAGLGHQTDRIGRARDLVVRLARGDRWDLVFNICEGLGSPAREAQVPALLELYGIPVTFADAAVMALSLNKGWTKAVVAAAGLPTPGYRVLHGPEDLLGLPLPLPLFVKPLLEGTGAGITAASVVRRTEDLAPLCRGLWRQFGQPLLLETFLPGREFTVGLLGTGDQARVLGTLEIHLGETAEPEVYSYLNKEECEERVVYQPVSGTADPMVREAERIALAAWRALGCRDAGRVDLRADAAGVPQFIEVNPLAGLHPEHSDLPMLATAMGMSYGTLIGEIVASASRRLPQLQEAESARRAAL